MIRKLSDREHLKIRPAMYIGSVNSTKQFEYISRDGKIVYTEVSYVPGLIKIINEIIDNSVDVAIKTNFTQSNVIDVRLTDTTCSVKDNGSGIPIKKNEDGDYLPKICWGEARSGSNFDDDANRTQIGMNGVGSFATNVFSSSFVGQSDDGENTYTVKFKDNAEFLSETVKPSSGKTGVEVKFTPDLSMFGIQTIDEVHHLIIKQRLINLSLSFPEITFKFNGRKINVQSFKKYVQMFGDDSLIYETEDYKFALLPNDSDDFKQFTYVNGLKIPDGGTHVDLLVNGLVQRVREKLNRKFKGIKPGDVKNKLMLVAFLKNFKNTKFNSQSKEKITNSNKEMMDYFNAPGEIPMDTLALKMFKNKAMMDPITEVYRIKEELKRRKELNALNKPKKRIKSDKYYPSIGTKKYLVLAEGECLSENTELMRMDFSQVKMSDVNVGDVLLNSAFEKTTVLSKVKLLKKCLTFNKGKPTEFTCGENHRMKVYSKKTKTFEYVEAKIIKQNMQNYKFLRSKINETTQFVQVLRNDNFVIRTPTINLTYTDDDNFVIIRDGKIERIHGTDIEPGDGVILA